MLFRSLDLWLYLFKNMHKLDEIPAKFRNNEFRGVFDIAKISNFNERELRKYEAIMKYEAVYNATIAYAERQAFGKGDKSGYGRCAAQVVELVDQGYSSAQIKRMLSKKVAVGV